MAFRIQVSVADAEGLTDEAIAAELGAGPQLTALESDTMVQACLAAAKDLVSALGHGPFTVTLRGIDELFRKGEVSFINVDVRSAFTFAADEAEPPDEAALVAEGEAKDAAATAATEGSAQSWAEGGTPPPADETVQAEGAPDGAAPPADTTGTETGTAAPDAPPDDTPPAA